MRHHEHTFPYATRFVDTATGRLAYFDEGRRDGDAILFVHGLGGDFTHFEHIAPAFAAAHRVVGVDMPGCGESMKPDARHSIAEYARTLLELLDKLGIASATLVGHSAGGLACAHAALRDPSRVRRLVLMNSAGLRPYPLAVRIVARLVLRPRLLRILLKATAPRILRHVFSERNAFTHKFEADALHPVRAPLLPHISKVFHDLGPDLMRPSLAERAGALEMPVLVIWGARDRLVPLSTVRRATGLLRRGRLVVIEEAGHMIMIEQPTQIVDLLRVFFAEPCEDSTA